MTDRREPTIHNRAVMVECPRCKTVPGARCLDTRGTPLKPGKVHRDRAAAYREREAQR
ncbi:zinc finger domain-containing protein [Streptomyces sp. NPDC055897]